MKKILSILIAILNVSLFAELPPEARTKDFVLLHEVVPSIMISPRYCSCENFMGRNVKGYRKPVIALTKQAAQALKKVQQDVNKDGFCLVVYDAYRPQTAVDDFIFWADVIEDQVKKKHYYPRVDKARVFELGYVAEKSGHSRGSTVDLTLIKLGDRLHEVACEERTLQDGFKITYLNDGTVDMGSSFDLFDIASHHENDVIPEKYKTLRNYLKQAMEKHGFKAARTEWWHYTLKNEPYPSHLDSSYFNFTVG